MKALEKIYLQVCGDCKDNDCKNCKFEDLEENIIIIEDYVSFEVAKLLKEKGFNVPCLRVYDKNGIISIRYLGFDIPHNYTNRLFYLCPTHQMAMAWLREVHNIYYEIQLLLGEKSEKYGSLQLGIYQLNSLGAYVWKDWIYADTYVELFENYIKYCLKNLI